MRKRSLKRITLSTSSGRFMFSMATRMGQDLPILLFNEGGSKFTVNKHR